MALCPRGLVPHGTVWPCALTEPCALLASWPHLRAPGNGLSWKEQGKDLSAANGLMTWENECEEMASCTTTPLLLTFSVPMLEVEDVENLTCESGGPLARIPELNIEFKIAMAMLMYCGNTYCILRADVLYSPIVPLYTTFSIWCCTSFLLCSSSRFSTAS